MNESQRESIKNMKNNFHPKIAKLIDIGIISLTNAMIMAKLPIDDQPQFMAMAKHFNADTLKKAVNDYLNNEINESYIKEPYIPENWVDNKLNIPDKNILFVIKSNIPYWALIPSSKLDKLIDLDELNGVSLNDKTIPIRVRTDILVLLKRLGIIDDDIDPDLKEYLNPCPPFHVDDICHISL